MSVPGMLASGAVKKGCCEQSVFDRIDKMPTPVKEATTTLTPE
jgi:hypothetical protein